MSRVSLSTHFYMIRWLPWSRYHLVRKSCGERLTKTNGSRRRNGVLRKYPPPKDPALKISSGLKFGVKSGQSANRNTPVLSSLSGDGPFHPHPFASSPAINIPSSSVPNIRVYPLGTLSSFSSSSRRRSPLLFLFVVFGFLLSSIINRMTFPRPLFVVLGIRSIVCPVACCVLKQRRRR